MVAYFTRGWGETFELPPPSEKHPTYIMVNEMSDHLPVYSWGPYVVRTFELLGDGYSLCTTVHAETVEGVLEQLEEDNGVPREHLAHLDFVVPLAIGHREGQTIRRVRDVGVIEPDGIERIARWDEKRDEFEVLQSNEERALLARRLGMNAGAFDKALADREAFLQKLLSDGVSDSELVHAAVEAFRDGVR